MKGRGVGRHGMVGSHISRQVLSRLFLSYTPLILSRGQAAGGAVLACCAVA